MLPELALLCCDALSRLTGDALSLHQQCPARLTPECGQFCNPRYSVVPNDSYGSVAVKHRMPIKKLGRKGERHI